MRTSLPSLIPDGNKKRQNLRFPTQKLKNIRRHALLPPHTKAAVAVPFGLIGFYFLFGAMLSNGGNGIVRCAVRFFPRPQLKRVV